MMHYGKFIQQAVFFLATLVLAYSCVFQPTVATYAWVIFGILLVGIIPAAFYHRFLTHNAWKCPRWLEVVLAIMAAGHGFTPAISWVAIHRKHHRYADTNEDPHGPHFGVMANALISFYKTDLKYAGSIMRDRLYQLQLKYYLEIMLVYMVIWSMIFGPMSWFIINGMAYLIQASINYIAHKDSQPVNLSHWHALLFSGETYHENHHRFPTNLDWENGTFRSYALSG